MQPSHLHSVLTTILVCECHKEGKWPPPGASLGFLRRFPLSDDSCLDNGYSAGNGSVSVRAPGALSLHCASWDISTGETTTPQRCGVQSQVNSANPHTHTHALSHTHTQLHQFLNHPHRSWPIIIPFNSPRPDYKQSLLCFGRSIQNKGRSIHSEITLLRNFLDVSLYGQK